MLNRPTFAHNPPGTFRYGEIQVGFLLLRCRLVQGESACSLATGIAKVGTRCLMKQEIHNMIRFAEGSSTARFFFAFALLLVTETANAIQVPKGLDTCPNLSACLAVLDKAVPLQDDGEGSNGEVLARYLRRFGEPAKQELLRRSIGTHPGWRNVAGAILADWGSWKSEDTPALKAQGLFRFLYRFLKTKKSHPLQLT
jgi:hypothetical protein